ncbi:MAG: hypothetical protein LBQ00_01475 [Syntrophobacterales bacterium]|jgi:fibronectin type 3 domain-containing protein|nr:hypothetical protein [Syntrophobacterales bacterium]
MRKNAISILIISVALTFFGVAGCGKKSFPAPQNLPIPGGIKDVAGDIKEGVLFLSFTIPSRDVTGAELKDLSGFRVLKSCGSCMVGFEPFKEILLEEQQGYTIAKGRLYITDDDLRTGFHYSYRVHPLTKLGTAGDASNTFTITWQAVPVPPAGVQARGEYERIELTWDKEENLLYNVYRLREGVYPLFPVNPAPLSTSFFVDSGLENGKTYQYEVRAVALKSGMRWEGKGVQLSAHPIDRTPPAAPREIKTEKNEREVLVTWKMNTEPDLLGYNVYRIASGKTVKMNTEPLKEPSYLDRNLPEARYVSYYVTAVDTFGNESENSKESIIILIKE